eukprot:TRINITY_DN441_c0_g2_i1.p1 TRINITY_DN441_c0_g2~~TRINITY_DN441_c0_g2_i1.p1  ORF type:complete len:348 (+),score=60.30 TRINITY_DN441_c0_g2_i1:54-1046(+)
MSKPFHLTDPYYNLDTYMGRVWHFYDVIDPRRLFTGAEKIMECKDLIRDFKAGKVDGVKESKKLWEARGTLSALMHPDTQEKLHPFFMPSSFIPVNVPISAGMLLSSPTMFNAALWQWVNQSYNAGFNYVNRPITTDGNNDQSEEIKTTLMAYGMACGVSCSVALGLKTWLNNAKLSPSVARACSVAVPFTAVAGAGAFNVAAMRYKEAIDGISVFDPVTNEDLGKSCSVAKTALFQCAMSRVVLPAPVLLLPPFVMPVVRSFAPKFSSSFLGGVVIDLSVLTASLSVGLPFAIALFPQRGTYSVDSLEPELKEKAKQLGIEHVRFNKGL